MCRRTRTAARFTDLPREVLALVLTLCVGPDLPALARVSIDFQELTSGRSAKIAVLKPLVHGFGKHTSIWSVKMLCAVELKTAAVDFDDVGRAIGKLEVLFLGDTPRRVLPEKKHKLLLPCSWRRHAAPKREDILAGLVHATWRRRSVRVRLQKSSTKKGT